MFVKVTEGVPAKYTLQQLHQDNPNTSFPSPLSAEALAAFNVFPLTYDVPAFDERYQVANETAIALINGEYIQQWTVDPLEAPVVREYLKAKAKIIAQERETKQEEGFQWTAPNADVYTIFTDGPNRTRYAELISAAREGIRLDGEKVRIGDAEGEPLYITATNVVLKTIFTETHAYFKKCAEAEENCLQKMRAHFQADEYPQAFAIDYTIEFSLLP